jgi:hypothetical protein
MEIANRNWPSSIPRILWKRHECPRCSSIEFRAAESHPLDPLLRSFALRPVRCVNCWRRYYWFAKKNIVKDACC